MSTAPTSTNIPIQEFRAKLQEAVDARSYHTIKVFTFRFEDDATQSLGARSLLIVAYIGRAIIDMESNELHLISENGNQKRQKDDSIRNLHVLAMLDCCYAGSAVRAGGKRSHSTVRSRQPGITFIQRFRAATAPDCVYKVIGNAHTLVFDPKVPIIQQSRTFNIFRNDTNVLFKISLTGGPNDVILTDFLQLTKTIPPEFKVTLANAYESNSVVVVCRASWETLARLRSTLGYVFIASVKGPSLVCGEMPEKPSTRSFGDLLDNRQDTYFQE
ncbi:hypothetical protein V1521DRAFT_474193 [Lipomyces starkeyi]